MSTVRLAIVLQLWVACTLLASMQSVFGQGTEFGRTLENQGRESHLSRRESGLDSSLPENRDRSNNIFVSLRADKSMLRPGDELALTAETNQGCFLKIMYVRPGGGVIVLWPNRESGGDGRIRAHTRVTVPGAGASFKIKVDGDQPQERIIAFAVSEKGRIFKPGEFRELPGGYMTAFVGNFAALRDTFRRRVHRMGRSLRWGTAHLTLPVSSAGERRDYTERSKPRFSVPFAVRSFGGKYLSLKNGKASFSADTIGPTETFRLQQAQNSRFKLVGYRGAPVTAPVKWSKGAQTNQFFDLMPLFILGVAFRNSDGRYMVADEIPGKGIGFTECAPSPFTRKGFFTLVPVKDTSTGAGKGFGGPWWLTPYPE